MADQGSSHWNGKYGKEERARRENYDNAAVKIARGLNTASRMTGLPYNKGAVGVQTNADILAAQNISDTVPRRK